MQTVEWKFRGYDAVGQKGWVYGDLVHNQKVTETGLEPRVMIGGYEVVSESVGICLRKKDNYNNPLYEGDICKIECYGKVLNGLIIFDRINGCFAFKNDSLLIPMKYVPFIQKVSTYYENKKLVSEHFKKNEK